MEKEVDYFDRLLTNPARPFYALLGGAKIGTKLGVLSALVSKVDALYIGGAMAFSFLKAQGFDVEIRSWMEPAWSRPKPCSKAIRSIFQKIF